MGSKYKRCRIQDFAPEAARELGYGIIPTYKDGQTVYTVVRVESRDAAGYITAWRPLPDLQQIYPFGLPQATHVLGMLLGATQNASDQESHKERRNAIQAMREARLRNSLKLG